MRSTTYRVIEEALLDALEECGESDDIGGALIRKLEAALEALEEEGVT